ncbi:KpLE2 phage-like element; P4-like integrase (fragment) [Xenorhabdus poinarii G6]|uniref:KpLE2 phage-like element P4-like integrase n=1 Tax=Xenorhabdus poinarii G6 TaxID=1354304 RepID=A0A068R5T9_9GAMM
MHLPFDYKMPLKMKLNARQIETAKPKERTYKLADARAKRDKAKKRMAQSLDPKAKKKYGIAIESHTPLNT